MKKNTLVMDTVEIFPAFAQRREDSRLAKSLIQRAKAGWALPQTGFWVLLAAVLFFSTLCSRVSAETSGALLEDISFHRESTTRETVSFKLNGPHLPKIFALKGEKPKVVFDFYDTRQSQSIKGVIKSNGNLVSAIRTAMHTDPQLKTRVALDLVPAGDYDFAQDFQIKDNTLIITVFHAQTKAEKTQEKISEEKTKNSAPLSTKTTLTPDPMKKEKAPTPAAEQKKIVPPVTPGPSAAAPDAAPKKPVPSSSPLAINMISFKQDPVKGEQISMQVTGFHPPVIFGVEEGTPSIVCDFLNGERGDKLPDLIPANGQFVKQIRVEKNPKAQKIRIVIELVPNHHYDLKQIFFKEEQLYVLFVKPQKRSSNNNAPTTNRKP
jgi:hypothetical protein